MGRRRHTSTDGWIQLCTTHWLSQVWFVGCFNIPCHRIQWIVTRYLFLWVNRCVIWLPLIVCTLLHVLIATSCLTSTEHAFCSDRAFYPHAVVCFFMHNATLYHEAFYLHVPDILYPGKNSSRQYNLQLCRTKRAACGFNREQSKYGEHDASAIRFCFIVFFPSDWQITKGNLRHNTPPRKILFFVNGCEITAFSRWYV